jgi:hypothetical protein
MPVAIIIDTPEDFYEESDSSMACRPQGCSASQATYLKEASPQFSARDTPNSMPSVRAQKESEGRCGDCGMQTHEMHVDPLTRTLFKVPLTIEREVHRGRCLFCHPIFAHQLLSHQVSCQQPSSVQQQQVSRPAASYYPLHQCKHISSYSKEPLTRSVNRSVSHDSVPSMTYSHAPVDPMVREALAIIQGSNFDIVDILSAMNLVPQDVVVQENGCERLWILSWEEENSAAIGRVGGISIILNAMARFPKNAHLQQCGCESLQNMALNDYNRREICELSGVHLIVQAMIRHRNVAGIQQCGCTALASIASSATCGKMHCSVIEQAGGLNAILNAAREFAYEESVLEAAYDALQAMGLNPGGRITPTSDEMMEGEKRSHIVSMDM